MASPHYLVGIDLGTTHTVVAYTEISDDLENSPTQIFDIDQLIAPGEVARKPLLPSFRYHPAQSEINESELVLPWQPKLVDGDIPLVIIGEYARELGAKVEGRQVVSAKSWLSHPNVDRTEAILPWSSSQGVNKVSPVIASASYLNHVRQSWNYHNPDHLLEQQEVVITVPASFDEAARALTLEAAKLAGLPKVLLLEEPQAVCYDWYAQNKHNAEALLKDIPLLMVCDVGGGTTDLSLIKVSSNNGELKLDRIGVGDHLMLGGDNLDLALAHQAEVRLHGGSKKLSAAGLSKLIQQTRKVKEQLLSGNAPDSAKVTLLGSGSRLIGGAKSVELTKEEVHQIALEGFFPLTEFSDQPSQRQAAVVEFGLPYAADPAISKHLAQFIDLHDQVCRDAFAESELTINEQSAPIPTAVLLNGGVFNSPLLSQRALDIFGKWKGDNVTQLINPHPDLSVAYGAVAYAKARHGAQLKIGGGSARSYFLKLDEKKGPQQGLCLLPKGTDEGNDIIVEDRYFALTLGEPVRFNLVSSTDDNHAELGHIVELDDESFVSLPPFIATLDSETDRTELAANQKDREVVTLACQLTEVGTLQVECVSVTDKSKRWKVEFAVRKDLAKLNRNKDGDSTLAESILPARIDEAIQAIKLVYGGSAKVSDNKQLKTLQKDLEKLLGKRDSWDTPCLRELATALLDSKKRRRRSDLHERTWLKLAGFTLRPGFGYPSDEWRMEQVWHLYQQGIQFEANTQTWSDWWTFWRRVAGGLTQEQQLVIFKDIAKYINPSATRNTKLNKEMQERSYQDMVRLAASLEHLPFENKLQLIEWLFGRLQKTQHAQAHWWAIGRIGTRSPFYGSAHNLLTAQHIAYCLPELMELNWRKDPNIGFAAVMMCRMTGDRTLDIDEANREAVIAKLKASKAPESWIQMVSEVKILTEEETKRVFGDALPSGLQLIKH
ncbi:molecular chaperone DnaK [Photobacterium jeanii]|uniref:Molecular chaperone DnaK n=1 Tax=Photobacterium jeanii TaxID=858640 RepID=A0A178KKI9_9GAMM|nr:Hsp70 family protein [Photobacterium jeanii]OAN17761.1 molecular chaperone DnaK [Photobacterium jeanii]PST92574.1 molecular chaperone DnaK [Photobacterium jeanii]